MLPQLDPEHIIALHCPLCPFLTLSVTRLFEHCMTHNAACECALLQCADCGKVSTHEGLLREHAAALHASKLQQQGASDEPRNTHQKSGIKRLSIISLNGGGRDCSAGDRLSVGDSAEAGLGFQPVDYQDDYQSQFPCLFCDEQLPGLADLELHCDVAHGLRQISVKTMHNRLQRLVAKALLGPSPPQLGGFLAAAAAAAAEATAAPQAQTQPTVLESNYSRQQLDPGQQEQRFDQPSRSPRQAAAPPGPVGFAFSRSELRWREQRLACPAAGSTSLCSRRQADEAGADSSPIADQPTPSGDIFDVTDDSATGEQTATSLMPTIVSPPAPLSASSLSFLTAPRGAGANSLMTAGGGGSAGRPSLQPLGARLAELGGELLEDQPPYSTRCTYCSR
uniref:C2H2-type domain-containing protein n=1 Tax=Macrostomum lignano TaxID=282301 RepID=A0A1I8JBB2_9PLAT